MRKAKELTRAEIRDWRMQRGISQLAMSKLLGVRPATISDWERGLKLPNLTILRLALRGLAQTMPRTHNSLGVRIPA